MAIIQPAVRFPCLPGSQVTHGGWLTGSALAAQLQSADLGEEQILAATEPLAETVSLSS